MRILALFRTRGVWIIILRERLRISCPASVSLVNIAIGNVNFIVRSVDAPLAAEPQSTLYTPFVADTIVGDSGYLTVEVSLTMKDFPSSEGLVEIFGGNGVWSMFGKGDEYYLKLNPSAPDGSESIARFALPLERAVVYCGKTDIVEVDGTRKVRNPFTYPLDQLLLMYALAGRQGALIHSSGVAFRGRGYMFTGRSGAGKSTLSRIFAAKGFEVVSDDRVVVRKIGDDFRLFGTPWAGEAGIAENKDHVLHGIFFIRHGPEHAIRKITPSEAVERLVTVTSIPWFDERVMTDILSFSEDVALHVPVYELSFKPDIGVVDFVEEFISH